MYTMVQLQYCFEIGLIPLTLCSVSVTFHWLYLSRGNRAEASERMDPSIGIRAKRIREEEGYERKGGRI